MGQPVPSTKGGWARVVCLLASQFARLLALAHKRPTLPVLLWLNASPSFPTSHGLHSQKKKSASTQLVCSLAGGFPPPQTHFIVHRIDGLPLRRVVGSPVVGRQRTLGSSCLSA